MCVAIIQIQHCLQNLVFGDGAIHCIACIYCICCPRGQLSKGPHLGCNMV
jgi:hypothetical protein